MEDVLDVYTRPYDPRFPQVCLDEASTQLLADARPPLPPAPGHAARQDYEYVRHGTANCFMLYEPLRGWREVAVTERRTKVDWARVVKDLLDVRYPDAERVVLVQDNLNTHTPASLYEAFPPAEAGRLARRLEIHPTPRHGSWLNMAEVELSVLARQCLNRRIADLGALAAEVAAWVAARNAAGAAVDWRFATADARIKLKHLYPAPLQPGEPAVPEQLLAMGHDVPDGTMRLRRGNLDIDWRKRGSDAYFARARGASRRLAREIGAHFVDNPLWHIGRTITVHPLGGCPMGRGAAEGVVDPFGEVFGYPGLYVADGSVMPGPVGANPSLTIAALADRFADKMIEKANGTAG